MVLFGVIRNRRATLGVFGRRGLRELMTDELEMEEKRLARRRTSAAVIAVDIGGTFTRVAAVPILRSGRLALRAICQQMIRTPRTTPAPFYDSVAALIEDVARKAHAEGVSDLPLVGLGQPGRFLPDGSISPSSSPNLGQASGDFDGVRPARELEARLSGTRVFAENDSTSQMRFAIEQLLRRKRTRGRLLDQVVVFLGIGTGFGGAAARIDDLGRTHVFTDSHLYDMLVREYWSGTAIAEELLSSWAVLELTRELRPDLWHRHAYDNYRDVIRAAAADRGPKELPKAVAQECGVRLARIIGAICRGDVVKVTRIPDVNGAARRLYDEPSRAWPAADKAAVTGVGVFLLGGGIGSDPDLGSVIGRTARREIRMQGIDASVLRLGARPEAGLVGAAHAIPIEIMER
jgi:predicted NBD/HSP70 family sugar kinase